MSLSEARAFWITGRERGEIRTVAVAPAGPGEVVITTEATAVSAGTERLVFANQVPESQWAVMRAPLQEGQFPSPVKYGYAAVGTVLSGPPELLGRRVFCLHPHQTRFLAPAAMAVPVPDTVPSERAILAANMETALNAYWDALPLPGERTAVVGAGVVGLLAAHVLAAHGHAPLVVDRDPDRRDVARALGLDFATPDGAAGPFDLVVHASAAPEALVWSLERLAFEGRVVELSWYGDRMVTLPLGAAFHSRRLRLISSQVGHIATPLRGRVDHRGRLERALAMLDDPRLNALIDTVVPFEDLPAFMGELVAGRRRVLCTRITYTPSKH